VGIPDLLICRVSRGQEQHQRARPAGRATIDSAAKSRMARPAARAGGVVRHLDEMIER
jgi:hypothetical protein